MSDQVRSVHRRGQVTDEQFLRDEEVRRLVMREFPPLQYVLVWFDKKYGQIRGFESLQGLGVRNLRSVLGVPDGPSLEGSHSASPEQLSELSHNLEHRIDLDRYLYRVRSQESEMLPLEELPPIEVRRTEQGDAA